MSAEWSAKGEKSPPLVSADEFMILDSQDGVPATQNKRVTLSTVQANVITDINVNSFDLFNANLITPTISDFTNALHNHQTDAGGSTLVATAALTATGTKDFTTFLRGDDTWDVPVALWTKSGSAIFPTTLTDSVGIGTNTPPERLSLEGGNFLQIPTDPTEISVLTDAVNFEFSSNLFVKDDFAYVVSGTNIDQDPGILAIINISDVTSPSIVSFFSDAVNMDIPTDVKVVGNYAYVTARDSNSLAIIDVTDPTNPTLTGSLIDAVNLNEPVSLVVTGKYAYVCAIAANRLTIVDISDPTNPTLVGTLQDNTLLDSISNVYVDGKYAYTTARVANSLVVIDVSDPTTPTIIGSLVDNVNLESTIDVVVRGSYAYVIASLASSLTVIDVSDPTTPTLVGTLIDNTNLNSCNALFLSGNFVYVACGGTTRALTVIDVTDPTNPTFSGQNFNSRSYPSVSISGKYAYLISQTNFQTDGSFVIMDIHGINSPAASIGNVETTYLSVTTNALINNNLYSNRLNVGNDALIGGDLSITGRLQGAKGADVSSMSGITLGNGNYFDITGNTTINTMTDTNWQAGSVVTLQFVTGLTVTHDSGGSSPNADFLLEGGVPFVTTAGDTLTIIFDGTDWRETSRSVI